MNRSTSPPSCPSTPTNVSLSKDAHSWQMSWRNETVTQFNDLSGRVKKTSGASSTTGVCFSDWQAYNPAGAPGNPKDFSMITRNMFCNCNNVGFKAYHNAPSCPYVESEEKKINFGSCVCSRGDYNNNDTVDTSDYNQFLNNYYMCLNCQRGVSCWTTCSYLDLDKDNRITTTDYEEMNDCLNSTFCWCYKPPPDRAVCDPNCGAGACGVRLPDNSCVADWGNAVYGLSCCHQGCTGSPPSCQYVVGSGVWDCASCLLNPTPTPTTVLTPCPCVLEQPEYDGYLMGLKDTYDPNKYSTFTSPNYLSQVDKVAIRAKRAEGQNAYPGSIVCKVTNDVRLGNPGSLDISVEKSSPDFYDTIAWQELNYSSNRFSLLPNTNYRLYCRSQTVPNNSGEVVNWTWVPPYGSNASRRICLCQVTPTPTATNTPTPSNTPTPTSTPIPRPWFQVENGHVSSSQGYIDNYIPNYPLNPNPYPYLVNSDPGGVALSSSSIWLGKASHVSKDGTDFLLEDYSTAPQITLTGPTLKELWNQSPLLGDEDSSLSRFCPGGIGCICTSQQEENHLCSDKLNDLPSGAYFTKTNVLIDNGSDGLKVNLTGGKVIVLFIGTPDNIIPGTPGSGAKTLTINQEVKVDNDSALVFLVSGNITIDPSVKKLDGIYYSSAETGGAAISTGAGNQQLVINGSLLAPFGRISFQRDLGDLQNKTTPAVLVKFQPKYWLKANAYIRRRKIIWEEVAP